MTSTRPAWARRLALGVLVAAALVASGLSGCAATQRRQTTLDNPWPGAGPAASEVWARDAAGRLHHLAPNASCLALVRAAEWHSTTNLFVEAGWVLEVEVPAGQRWFDAGRITTAPDGDDGSAVMRLFQWMKRHGDEPYFALMVAVVACEAGIADRPGARQCEAVDAIQPTRIARSGARLVVPSRGELAFHVNDAELPGRWKDAFYGNNQGQVWVRITRRAPP